MRQPWWQLWRGRPWSAKAKAEAMAALERLKAKPTLTSNEIEQVARDLASDVWDQDD